MEPVANKSSAVRRLRRAFTIVELLVALGVTAVMLTLMINISINMLKMWNQAGGRLSSGNQARVALDYLSQDLQAALIRRNGGNWLAATVQRDQSGANNDAGMNDAFTSVWDATGQSKPNAGSSGDGDSLDLTAQLPIDTDDKGKIENIRFGKGGVWFRFFTTPPDSNSGSVSNLSAPRAVSYQISRGRIGAPAGGENGQFVYSLFRAEAAPDATFAAGFNILDPKYDTYNAATAATSKLRRPTINDLIANNVVDFGVRLYANNSSGVPVEVFPVNRLGGATAAPAAPFTFLATSASPAPAYTSYGNSAVITGVPTVAEVMVRILTPEGQRLLNAFEDGVVKRPSGVANDAVYWWQIVKENSQVYVRRIEIRATPL